MTAPVLVSFPRTTRTQVRLTLTEYRGQRLVDLRLYFRTEEGEWLPSRKGCGVRPEELDHLIAALEVARGRLTQ